MLLSYAATNSISRKRLRQEEEEEVDGQNDKNNITVGSCSRTSSTSHELPNHIGFATTPASRRFHALTSSFSTRPVPVPSHDDSSLMILRNVVSPSPLASEQQEQGQYGFGSNKKRVLFATGLDGNVLETHHRLKDPFVNDAAAAVATTTTADDKVLPMKNKRKAFRRMVLPLHKKKVQPPAPQEDKVAPTPHFHRDSSSKMDLWWTKKERALILQQSRQIAKRYKKTHPHDVQQYQSVYDTCVAQRPSSRESSSSSNDDFLLESSSTAVPIVVPTIVRGLEWCVAPRTKTHRKVHVQDILQCQRRLLWHCSSPLNDVVVGGGVALRPPQELLLSSCSIRSSQASRIMARLIGKGDELGLEEDNDEDEKS
jgi:hypothetical protein